MVLKSENQEQLSNASAIVGAGQWRTVVHNDPINLMSYVQWVFESYFAMDTQLARAKMLQVHQAGRAVVAEGGKEQMEKDAQAMHTFGLWATIEPAPNRANGVEQ